MKNSAKVIKQSSINYPIRYSIYDTSSNDTTIYKKNRNDFLKCEMINIDFMHVQDNSKSEFVIPICHIEL